MKIKTITCHDVYNYGASLQAFALQSFLESNGHDVEIIDYKPNYIDLHYKVSTYIHPDSPLFKYLHGSFLLRLIYGLKRFVWYIPSWSRKMAFDAFTRTKLKLTKTYKSYSALCRETPDADTYIVGSDQVWNSVTMYNGNDPTFYLQFAPKAKKRIAYAASFGSTSCSEEHREEIKQWLSSLGSISVREKSGVELLNRLGINGTHVCDPVFLLTENEWRSKLNIGERSERYVLIYNLTSRNEKLVNDAKRTAECLGVKLYSVSPFKIPEADLNFNNVGPEEFISLIFNSSYVFTNSFHATALSIIARRQFCTYNYHSISNSSRMYSVLEEMDLLDRLNPEDVEKSIKNPINYDCKSDAIEASANRGRGWLLNNI